MLCARQQRPSSDMCREAAEQLVLKYPFMQDPFGKRYVSYSWGWSVLCCTCIVLSYCLDLLVSENHRTFNQQTKVSIQKEQRHQCSPLSKHPRVVQTSSRIHCYPVLQVQQIDNEDAILWHLHEAQKEMQRGKPRILLQLILPTFQHRRDRIASGSSQSVWDMLELFPTLKRPAVVSVFSLNHAQLHNCMGYN